MTHKDAQRAAVRRQFLHVEKSQAMRGENLLRCVKRKIGEVFMVDGVKLILIHQPMEMRKFHRNDATRFQKNLHAANEVIYIRHLGQNVVAEKQIRLFPGSGEFACCFPPEEFDECRHALFDGYSSDIRGGLDAKDWDFALYEILQ